MHMDAIQDVSAFGRLGMDARKDLGRRIAERLGDGWRAGEPAEGLDGLPLHHAATGLPFVVVPGGSFEMGLTATDLAELRAYLRASGAPDWESDYDYLDRQSENLRPPHQVRVHPFVVARARLLGEEVERLSEGRFRGAYCYNLRWREARELAASHGLRLPSEAEHEWLARDGGRYSFTLDSARRLEEIEGDSELLHSRFGVRDLCDDQWAEDDYHPSYEGAPDTSIPWMNGMNSGVARGIGAPENVDEPHQIASLLAALRSNETHGKACIRFARDLP